MLGAYSFKLFYLKAKDMNLRDRLSRMKLDKCNLYEIIPNSLDLQDILKLKYYILNQVISQIPSGTSRSQPKSATDLIRKGLGRACFRRNVPGKQ